MSSNKTKQYATSVHLFLEDLVPEEGNLIDGYYTEWWFAFRKHKEFFGVLPLSALVIIIINTQAEENTIGFKQIYFLKMSLNFILSVIFPTRNLIWKPLENTKKAKVVYMLKS